MAELRSRKLRAIFEAHDADGDGRLNRGEMARLVAAVNPSVSFTQGQIKAILDEVFRTYGRHIEDGGLSLDGLARTYDDGAGDVDRDFTALGLRLEGEDAPPPAAPAGPGEGGEDDDGQDDARSETSYYTYTQSVYSGYSAYSDDYSETKSEASEAPPKRPAGAAAAPTAVGAKDGDASDGSSGASDDRLSDYTYDYDTETASVYTDAYSYSQYTDYTEDDGSAAALGPGDRGGDRSRGRSPVPRPSIESQRAAGLDAAAPFSPAAAAAAAEIDAAAEAEAAAEAARAAEKQSSGENAQREGGTSDPSAAPRPVAAASADDVKLVEREEDGDDSDEDARTENTYDDDTYSMYSESEYTRTAYSDDDENEDARTEMTEMTEYTEYTEYESVITETEYTEADYESDGGDTERDYELAQKAREERKLKEAEQALAEERPTIQSFSEQSPEAVALKTAAKEVCTTHTKPAPRGKGTSRAERDAMAGALVVVAPAVAAAPPADEGKPGFVEAVSRRVLGQSKRAAAAAAAEAACAELRRRADAYGPSPLEFWCHLAIASGFAEHGWFEEALPSLRACVALTPALPTPWFRMGNVLFALGRQAEARESYESALQACVDAMAAEVVEATADGPEAAREAQKRVHPLLPKVHLNLGVAFESEGMLMSACEHYRETALLVPSNQKALKLLGSALLGLGEHEAARDALGHAIMLNPEYADAHCDLGIALADSGDYAGARAAFEETVKLDEKHASAWYNLGNTHRMLDDNAAAVAAYDKAEAADPSNWRAVLNAACALLSLGQTKEAVARLDTAWRKSGERVELYDMLKHLRSNTADKGLIGSLVQRYHARTAGGSGGDSPADETNAEAGTSTAAAAPGDRKGKAAGKGVADPAEILLHEKDEDAAPAATDKGEVASAPFGVKNDRVSSAEHIAAAIKIRLFQKRTRVGRCPVRRFRDEAKDSNLPDDIRAAGRGRQVRKARIERILRTALQMEGSKQFASAMRVMNVDVFRSLDRGRRGVIDLSIFLAVLAPLARGSLQERLGVIFEVLLWRRPELSAEMSLTWDDAREYFNALRGVCGLAPCAALPEDEAPLVSATIFARLFTDDDIGFGGVLKALMKMERGDQVHHGIKCAVTCREIVGPRYTCTSSSVRRFDICYEAYAGRRVPKEANKAPPATFVFEEHIQPPTPGEMVQHRFRSFFRGGG